MTHTVFPERIETDRLAFERLTHERIDLRELASFFMTDEWLDGLDEMPWFRFESLDDVAGFVDHAEQQWADRESARYLLRKREPDRELIGTTAFSPEWERRRATADVVLSTQFWGQGYGLERAEAFLELAFGTYEFEIYYTSCVPDNEPSRRMIEKLIEAYGGRYEGRLRNEGSPRPDGTVTDQHRYSISSEEYQQAVGTERDLTIEFHREG